jgi:archaellum biogenesis protein FlaJ (TadC family)
MISSNNKNNDSSILERLKKEVRELVGSQDGENGAAAIIDFELEFDGSGNHDDDDDGDDDDDPIASDEGTDDSKKYRYYSTPVTSRVTSLLSSAGAKARAFRAALIATAVLYAFALTSHPFVPSGLAIAAFDLFVGLDKIPSRFHSAASTIIIARRNRSHQHLSFNIRQVPAAVERSQAYRWARKEFQERLRLASSGVALAGSATDRARKYLNVALALSPAMIFAAGAAAVMVNPYFAFLIAVPGVVIAAPFLSLKLKKAERGEIDDELPFFLIVAEMLALVEKPLIHAFELVASSGDMLPKMRKEAEIVRRDVNAFGYTPDQAIDRLARTHPNAELRSILNGYSSSMSLGQSVAQYLQNKAEAYLGRLEARYERYKDNAGTVGELVLIMLMIMPLTASISTPGGGSTAGQSSMQQFMLLLAIPSIAVAMFFMLDRAQVKGPDQYRSSSQGEKRGDKKDSRKESGASGQGLQHQLPIIPTISAAAAAAAAVIVSGFADPVAILLVSVASFSLPYGVIVRRRIKTEDIMVLELAEFLRTVAEVMKTGMDVLSAIRHTSTDRFTVLRPHIRRIKLGLASGGTLDSLQLFCQGGKIGGPGGGSFYMRYSLLIMSALAASGATSYAMLDRLAEYLGRIREQNAKVKKSVMVYGFLVVTSPLFMMFTIHAMASMTGQFTTLTEGTGGDASRQVNLPEIGSMPTPIGSVDPQSPAIRAMLVLTALGAGVLGGKMMSRTIRDTVPLAIACIIALVSPALLDVVWPIEQVQG